MNNTPKTDEVVKIMRDAASIFWALPEAVQQIRADDVCGRVIRDELAKGAQWRLQMLNTCTITADDLKAEIQETCPDFASLPTYVAAFAAKIQSSKVPADIQDYLLGNNGVYHELYELGMYEVEGDLAKIAQALMGCIGTVKDVIAYYKELPGKMQEARLRIYEQVKKGVIDESGLKKYFQIGFYNKRNGGIDWFQRLMEDLKTPRTTKDYARIANMIYKGGWMIPATKPKTFKTWYKTFCDLAGCDEANYKPSTLKDLQGFSYLIK